MLRHVVRDVQINRYAQHFLKGRFELHSVEKGYPPFPIGWYGHEKVKVASVDVVTAASRTEDSDVNETVSLYCLAEHVAFASNSLRWFHGFPDPTKAPKVRQLLKGIRAVHPAQQKQATPLALLHLEKAVAHLEDEAAQARAAGNMAALLKATRDIALLTIGFWRGFRGDELARLTIENTHAERYVGIRFYLGSTKGDRQNIGREYKTPSLSKLCPVEAYLNWIEAAGLTRGSVFRAIDRWGNISERPLAAHSLIPLLRDTLDRCGLQSEAYSTHSIRRGFATWAASSGWDIKTLMGYVGWSDVKSALRYVEPAQQFGGLIRKLEK